MHIFVAWCTLLNIIYPPVSHLLLNLIYLLHILSNIFGLIYITEHNLPVCVTFIHHYTCTHLLYIQFNIFGLVYINCALFAILCHIALIHHYTIHITHSIFNEFCHICLLMISLCIIFPFMSVCHIHSFIYSFIHSRWHAPQLQTIMLWKRHVNNIVTIWLS